MYKNLVVTINKVINSQNINEERKTILHPLIDFAQEKVNNSQEIILNFICTHNSRRSHLSQVWAQVAAAYYNIPDVGCYSGGTEETTLFPKVVETFGCVKNSYTVKHLFRINVFC